MPLPPGDPKEPGIFREIFPIYGIIWGRMHIGTGFGNFLDERRVSSLRNPKPVSDDIHFMEF
jgi:hypothetical protein